MTENSDLERYQTMLTQLRAMSNKQMACELECSRLAAENERLKSQLLATAERNGALELQNARMREALEKYADRRNWEYRPGLMEGDCDFFFLPGNGWDVAEKALEENSHE